MYIEIYWYAVTKYVSKYLSRLFISHKNDMSKNYVIIILLILYWLGEQRTQNPVQIRQYLHLITKAPQIAVYYSMIIFAVSEHRERRYSYLMDKDILVK